MRSFRCMMLTATLLATAGLVSAQSPRPTTNTVRPAAPLPHGTIQAHFLSFLTPPFCISPTALSPQGTAADREAHEEESENSCEKMLADCLQTWQMLCRSGLFDEAENTVRVMLALDPQCPKVHAASNVTRTLQAMRRAMKGCEMPNRNTLYFDLMARPVAYQPAVMPPADDCCQPACGRAASCQPVCSSECCPVATATALFKALCTPSGSCCKAACAKACSADGASCCAKIGKVTIEKNGCNRDCSVTLLVDAQDKKACGCKEKCGCCESCAPKSASPAKTVRLMTVPPCCGTLPAMPCTTILPPPAALTPCTSAVALNAQHVHLSTPHFEAHCDRMSCQGQDRLVLEGDVRLTCKKHGQPVRIEAPRVVVDVKDGTFTVDGGTNPTRAATPFGCQRAGEVLVVPCRSLHTVPEMPRAEPCPTQVPSGALYPSVQYKW